MIIAVDTETTGLYRWKGDKPFAIGICYENYDTEYISCLVNPKTREPQWSLSFVSTLGRTLEEIRIDLENPEIEKVFHNAKFDLHMLESIKIFVHGKVHDTILMARNCFTQEENYKLKHLAKKYINISDSDEKDLKQAVIKARRKAENKADAVEADYFLAPKLCERYCCIDTIRTMKLFQFYWEGLEQL